jgi:hypothetical protein
MTPHYSLVLAGCLCLSAFACTAGAAPTTAPSAPIVCGADRTDVYLASLKDKARRHPGQSDVHHRRQAVGRCPAREGREGGETLRPRARFPRQRLQRHRRRRRDRRQDRACRSSRSTARSASPTRRTSPTWMCSSSTSRTSACASTRRSTRSATSWTRAPSTTSRCSCSIAPTPTATSSTARSSKRTAKSGIGQFPSHRPRMTLGEFAQMIKRRRLAHHARRSLQAPRRPGCQLHA